MDVDSAARFDIAVAPGGYAWWYLDALSDDGAHGLTLIAFIGSVFSPYYAMARRRHPQGLADAENHCAFNVALYGRGGSRWAMTERGRSELHRDAASLRIGPSAMRWRGDALEVDIDEVTMPLPSRVRGRITLQTPWRLDHTETLAPGHRWCPIATAARVSVDLGGQRWTGRAYLDSNRGEEPLERAFERWDWSRAGFADGSSAVFYDVRRQCGDALEVALRIDPHGAVSHALPPAAIGLPRSGWRVARGGRGDAGTPVRVVQTLTDAPFYARSLLDATWYGERVTAMHESLSLSRFDTALVQAMLPFRMPRRPGRTTPVAIAEVSE